MLHYRTTFVAKTLPAPCGPQVAWFYTKSWVADPRALVLYAAAAGGGFAAAENIQYLYGALAMSLFMPAGDAVLWVAIARAVLSIPLHVGCGLIIGARLGQVRHCLSLSFRHLSLPFTAVLLHRTGPIPRGNPGHPG